MRMRRGRGTTETRPARTWGRVLLLCLLVIAGGVGGRLAPPAAAQPRAAMAMASPAAPPAPSSAAERVEAGSERAASCHLPGECVSLAQSAWPLPVVPDRGPGGRRGDPAGARASRPVHDHFRPPRLPAQP